MKILKSLFAKKYYWYQIKIHYKESANGNEIFNFIREVGLVKQNTILSQREVLKMFPIHKQKRVPKHLLKNGVVYFTINCYLGKMECYSKKINPC